MKIKNFKFTEFFLILEIFLDSNIISELKYQFSYLNNKFQSSNINFEIHYMNNIYTYV
jgi:hypothetical protein